MTEEPYLPAPSKSQEPDQAAETVSAEQEEFEVEVEERESYQERTSGSYTDSYEEGSGSVAGYRIPYRLMREGSPPPQPTHQAPGLPRDYSKYPPRTILVETSQSRRPSYVSSVCVQQPQWPGRGHSSHW